MAAAEQKKSYKVAKNFEGVNTKANRTAIKEAEFSWLENAMPVGPGNIKVIPTYSAVTSSNVAVTFANSVTHLTSANIGLEDYVLAFETDGRAEYVKVSDGSKGNIASSGTFSSSGVQVTQWENERAIICDPSKGLYSWDGTSLISIGSVGGVFVTNGGSGYTSTPAVVISAPNEANGVQATATPTLVANVVTAITVTNAGTGYTSPPTVTITGGGGANATAIAALTSFKTGTVSISVTNGGTGYSNAANISVTISGGGGSNAAATAVTTGNVITAIVMTNLGTGYTSNPTVSISGGGGSNATATAVANTDVNVGVASFSGRIWVAAGRTIYYSAARSYSDFGSVSAGNLVLTDSTLHGNIYQILSANNFLYIFGDDSINVFSDVRVSSSGTTLFTNTNVSASTGTKLPYAIFPYFRSVLFMNQYGVYALVGSTTTKISDALDGIFASIDFSYPVYCGQVLLSNILCAAFNFRYNDPNGARFIQAVFFDKKWFFSSQNSSLSYITSIPVGGKIVLYGTDGTNLYKLYNDSSSNINSIVQTALWSMEDPIRDKQALKIGIEATVLSGATLNVTVDSETSSSQIYSLQSTNYVNWINNSLAVVSWTNNFGGTVQWSISSGYSLFKTDATQYGKYLGMTVASNASAITYNTFETEYELRARF